MSTPWRPWTVAGSALALLLAMAAAAWGAWLWRSTDQALDRQSLPHLTERSGGSAALEPGELVNVLVVGSDSREDLTPEERDRLTTGRADGENTDTILLVQLRSDGASVVSFPRDLRLELPEHGPVKLNGVLSRVGPDGLVGVVEELVGIDLDHYVEVAMSTFVEAVDAVGGVEICLDEPLVDVKSGADFSAGCHEMDGVEALSYVRSRSGDRGDFDRIDRQQDFLAALAGRASDVRVLADPQRVSDLALSVADGLTVDESMSLPRLLRLAHAGRAAVGGGLQTYTLPAYRERIDGVEYVIGYEPAVAQVGQALRAGEELPELPSRAERQDTDVLVWATSDPAKADRVRGLLYFAGWEPDVQPAPGLEPEQTVVYAADGGAAAAGAIGALLGAPVRPAPPEVGVPPGVEVVVAVTDAPMLEALVQRYATGR